MYSQKDISPKQVYYIFIYSILIIEPGNENSHIDIY